MKKDSTQYTFGFAAIVCLVFSVLVASAAVSLKPRQERNALVYKQKNVLVVAGAVSPGESLTAEEISQRFKDSIRVRLIDLASGEYVQDESTLVETFDQRKAISDPAQSKDAPTNPAKIRRLPNSAIVYHVLKDNKVDMVILPIEGKGLWSTLYGFLALDKDMKTIRGITFYEHAETPGLGGEIDNPNWKALWESKIAFDDSDNVVIEVIKGQSTQNSKVDGLSGATLTSRGVSNLVRFWLGDMGFGPYIGKIRQDSNVLSVT